ncbi:unnamed protein product [Larinioides sclopetarius]|uniref:MATH domain-containing protein n=1 Tax=Larinioides sclopetarius TaxID=280406 RepID=A0AAV2AZ74_9ARAC
MAEGDLKGVVTSSEKLLNGHIVICLFNFYRLDVIKRTFFPLKYDTECRTIPTSWKIELKCEHESDVCESYDFSIKLKRQDSSGHRVKASLNASFYDTQGEPALYPISASKERMINDDELEGIVYCILPSTLREVAAVEVKITIQKCHGETDWHCASKLNTEKNNINLSKL